MSYDEVFTKGGWDECTAANVRKRGLFLTRLFARMGDNRLSKTALLGQWKGALGGQEFDLLTPLQGDLAAFGAVTNKKRWEANAKGPEELYDRI